MDSVADGEEILTVMRADDEDSTKFLDEEEEDFKADVVRGVLAVVAAVVSSKATPLDLERFRRGGALSESITFDEDDSTKPFRLLERGIVVSSVPPPGANDLVFFKRGVEVSSPASGNLDRLLERGVVAAGAAPSRPIDLALVR